MQGYNFQHEYRQAYTVLAKKEAQPSQSIVIDMNAKQEKYRENTLSWLSKPGLKKLQTMLQYVLYRYKNQTERGHRVPSRKEERKTGMKRESKAKKGKEDRGSRSSRVPVNTGPH